VNGYNGVSLGARAAGAVIYGNGATISNFADGISVSAHDTMLGGFSANGNGVGVWISGGGGAQMFNFDSSNNEIEGVFLFASDRNRFTNFTASHNGSNGGVYVLGSSDNQFSHFTCDFNGGPGVTIGPICHGPNKGPCEAEIYSRHSMLIGGEASNNQSGGIVIYGARHSRIVGNSASTNNGDDLADYDRNCDHNLWFANQFTTANASCIN
jgi:hypothetical protein